LEADVTQYLKSKGYAVDSAPYHNKMDKSVVNILQNIYTPTALYLRGRADRIAVRASPPIAFEWEAKTRMDRKYCDCVLEALPLCTHLLHARNLDTRCLYVYRNLFKSYDVGFWVHQMPPVHVIVIPSRWNELQKQYFKEVFKLALPQVRIEFRGKTKGSGDPFLIINESEIKKMSHWKELIQEMDTSP